VWLAYPGLEAAQAGLQVKALVAEKVAIEAAAANAVRSSCATCTGVSAHFQASLPALLAAFDPVVSGAVTAATSSVDSVDGRASGAAAEGAGALAFAVLFAAMLHLALSFV
jgi:hypothetical protein